jgi:O-antigen/teichoic acid export membrane protein
LARFLVPADVGRFGLLAATIGYALYVLGLEFYVFTVRELIAAPPGERLGIIRDQAAFHGLCYLVGLPLFLVLFAAGWLPWEYAGWFLALLVLEHVAQELNRILIALSEQLLASTILFVRSGAWCFAAIAIMASAPSMRSVEFVLAAWMSGAVLACAIGLARIACLAKPAAWRIDWARVRAGLRVALPFLLASLALRGLFTIDRYWVEYLSGLEVLGAYVLFVGMATAVLSFLDAAVVDFNYPRIVAAAKSGDEAAFRARMSAFGRSVGAVTAVLTVACWLASAPLLAWLDAPAYTNHVHLLKWLLLATGLYALSTIPHVGLYAYGRDRPLVLGPLAGIVAFLCTCSLGGAALGTLVVPLALCAAFFVILSYKWAAYVRLRAELRVAAVKQSSKSQ